MKKYYLVDQKNGDIFTDIIPKRNAADAIIWAKAEWDAMSDYDKKQRQAYYVALGEEDEDLGYDFEEEEFIADIMKENIGLHYWLDLSLPNGDFILYTQGDDNIIEAGNLQAIGADGDDWQNVLDEHFEEHLGILPNEWEIG